MDEKENVSIETPDYLGELSKETADEVAQINAEAEEKLKASVDESEQEEIKKQAEEKKKAKAEQKAQSKFKTIDDGNTKVAAVKVAVSGVFVNDSNKSESYEFDDIVLPKCSNVMSYLKQAVFLRFKQAGKPVPLENIITYYLDDETDIEMDATFLNKDVLKLTEQEVLCAKIYYKLKGVSVDQGVRQARVSAYKAVCKVMGRPAPDDTDTQIAKWARFKLTK